MRGTSKSGNGVVHVARRIKVMLALVAVWALSGCGGGGNSVNPLLFVGTSVINLSGGAASTTGSGGKGGTFRAYSSARSDLRIHANGTVDASFGVPGYSFNFGSNPVPSTLHPVTDFSVALDPGTPSEGQLYMKTTNPGHLYLGTGTGTDNVVTGLIVPATKTISFPAPVTFSDAVVVNGTVQSSATAPDLTLTAGSLQINNGGKITTAANDTKNTSGAGGKLNLVAASGVVINLGTIDSSGANGGSAGTLVVSARTYIYNANNAFSPGSGTIAARGGDNAGGAGGAGGTVSLCAAAGSFYTSGTIDASGGNATGSTGNGGTAGGIQLVAGDTAADTVLDPTDTSGKVAVNGTVSANGGTAAAGNGGSGGTITQISHGQPLLVNATISAVGGSGGTGSAGGTGGELDLFNLLSFDPSNNVSASLQGIKVAGSINLNGGAGANGGGNGGTLVVKSEASPNALPGSATGEFFGYGGGINLNGGAGKAGVGGQGGTFAVTLASAVTDNVILPAGGVYNEVGINARGGDGMPVGSPMSGTGGGGGTVIMQTPAPGYSANPGTTIISNSGPIDVSGGAGNTGGSAGTVTLSGYDRLNNSGAIAGTGGSGTTTGGAGSSQIFLSATNDIGNSGPIAAFGGSATQGNGGAGGNVLMVAGHQVSDGAGITAGGGNASGGNGGQGGKIQLYSQTLATGFSFLQTLNVAGGSGGTALNGSIFIDGVDVTPTSGSLVI